MMPMTAKVKEILHFLNINNYKYNYRGKDDFSIKGYSSIDQISSNRFSWVKNLNYLNHKTLLEHQNVLLVISKDIEIEDKYLSENGIIICDNPKEIFFAILNEFSPPEKYSDFISPKATVESSYLGENVYIGHYSFISKDAKLGNNVVIKNNVSIEGSVEIGDNTIIHSGVKIGTDGFGYYQDEEGKNLKVPHYGGVVIGRDVEIGANTCIDRGTLGDTQIGDNVKVNNLCHIAHNVLVEENCLLMVGVKISGSTVINKNAYIAPGAVILNQLTIGDNCLIGSGSVVVKDVEGSKVVYGSPAKVIRDNK